MIIHYFDRINGLRVKIKKGELEIAIPSTSNLRYSYVLRNRLSARQLDLIFNDEVEIVFDSKREEGELEEWRTMERLKLLT